jgi:hypothetical protein
MIYGIVMRVGSTRSDEYELTATEGVLTKVPNSTVCPSAS